MTEGDACRWFGILVECESQDKIDKHRSTLREIAIGIVTLGISLFPFSPKRFCDVSVRRLDNGKILQTFDYEEVAAATMHVVSLENRMREMSALEFCEQLGIPQTEVQGLGVGGVEVHVEWTYIPIYARRVS